MSEIIIIILIGIIFSTLFLCAIFLCILASHKEEIWEKIIFSKKGE